MNITLCEAKLIAAIAFNEMNKSNGRRPHNADQTQGMLFADDVAESIGKTAAQVRGVLKTLDRSGLVDIASVDDDQLEVILTGKGFSEFDLEFCPNAASLTVALEEIDEYFKDKPTNHQKTEKKTLPFCDEAGFPVRALVEDADMSELLAFYNANVAENKMVKRFNSKEDAVKKVLTLLAVLSSMGGEQELAERDEALLNAKSNGVKVHKTRKSVVKPPKQETTEPDDDNLTDEEWEARLRQDLENAGNGESEPKPKRGPIGGANRESIARSWSDGSVKAARLTRNGVTVTVNGKVTEHKSVRAAFQAYSLPDSKHIRFRLRLKEERNCIFEHNNIQYLFQII